MPQCLNDSQTHYTGKEPSPKGRGYCAHAMPISARKRGTDGLMWVVTSRIDGTKYWKKLPLVKTRIATAKHLTPARRPATKKPAARGYALTQLPMHELPKKLGPLDLYTVQIPKPRWKLWESQMSINGRKRVSRLRLNVIPQLRAVGIPSIIVPLPKDRQNGGYWMDLAWEYATLKLGYPPGENGPVLMCVLWLDVSPAEISKTKKNITIQQLFAKKKDRILIDDIMRAAFGTAFKWDGTDRSEMILSLV